jgi:NADH-quinone oxidoreductase subunit C
MIPTVEELHTQFTRIFPASTKAVGAANGAPAGSGDGPSEEPAPVEACKITDHKAKGYHLDIAAPPDRVVAAAELLDRNGFAIDTVTGVDWMAAGEMEVVYDFFHIEAPIQVVVRTRVPRENPELPTICLVFPGANWHERETHEFFGIRFLGHPNLTPLLLPEDATYHPLRKDFAGAS